MLAAADTPARARATRRRIGRAGPFMSERQDPPTMRGAGGLMSADPKRRPFAPRAAADIVQPTLHQSLREATRATHERLHLHPGFLAVQNGTIAPHAYRALLSRLYGFHLPFEQSAATGADRSGWLCDDLAVLGMSAEAIASLALCDTLPRLDNGGRRLGALYVIEGSALGGLVLGKSLDGLLGFDGRQGRRFFFGHGRGAASAWSVFLAQLADPEMTPACRHDTVEAAVQTFAVFEEWLNGWEETHGCN